MKRSFFLIIVGLLAACSLSAQVMPEQKSRLTVGGYGEITFTRNFYSDNVYRYSHPGDYKSDPGHGRFDVPHAVVFLGYDFGKGWTMQTEIPQFNVRIGHIVVPVGGLNNAHEPLNFFTVFRPEGESTILPSTWHDTGLSLWGEAGKWRYEALVVAGLDAFMYDRDNFIKHGAGTPYEFKVANNLGFAARVDNFSVKDLRLSLSGFYGQGMHNSYPNDMWNTRYAGIQGHTAVGAFDFAYTGRHLTVRGNADFGYVSDAQVISTVKRNLTSNNAPYKKTPVGSAACAFGLEAGYDFLHLFARGGETEQQLYLFGRYEYYDSYIPAADQPDYPYTDRHRMAVGLNWLPIPEIAVKCEYSHRFLKSQYNDEPSISLGIVYMGFFNR